MRLNVLHVIKCSIKCPSDFIQTIILNNSLLFVELPTATSPENNVVASTTLTAEQILSLNLKALAECPIALQSIYQTTQAKRFEGKIPMKKRKPTQTTTLLQPLTPTLYPSSLCKLPSTTAIQILSQPNDRKPIIIPPKMEVTIQPKAFPTQQMLILPQPTIVKIEKVEKHGDEEEEVTHFEIAPINISSINSLNSSLQLSTNSLIPTTTTIKICNSSSSLGVEQKPSSSSSSILGEVETAAEAAATTSSSAASPSTSSSTKTSLQTTTTTTNTANPTTSPGKT